MDDRPQIARDTLTAYQLTLREQLQCILVQVKPPLYADIMRALEEPGKLLMRSSSEETPAGLWSLITVLVAQSILPTIDLQIASSAALAVELFVCALDLLDDIEDEDRTLIVQELGSARVLNISTTLLMLAQHAITSLIEYEVDTKQIVHLLKVFEDLALTAVVGQHQDLLAESKPFSDFTTADCMKMIEMKSGALMSLPFCVGALCAGADKQLCEKMALLGKLWGIAGQLDNDSHALSDSLYFTDDSASSAEEQEKPKNVKTDLIRGKKTFPIVLAAQAERDLQEEMRLDDIQIEKFQSVLHESIVATWGMVLLYRERARDCLQEIDAIHSISPLLHHLLKL